MTHPTPRFSMLVLLGSLWLALHGIAADFNLTTALDPLREYRFGQERVVVDAIESIVLDAQSNSATRPAVARQLAEFLTTDATYDARQFVCRQLVLVTDESTVPTLAPLVSDPELSPMILHVLNRLPGPAVDRSLRQALPEAQGTTRLGIIELIGRRRDPESTALLAPLLDEHDPVTVATAATALGSIASPAALHALESSWAAVAPSPRRDLAEALFLGTTRLLADNRPTEAVRIFSRVMELTTDPHLLAAAFRGRVLADPEASHRLLLEALREVGTERQALAATCVRELPPSFDFAALLSALPTLPVSSQILLVHAFADRRLAEARTALQDLATDAEPKVRVVCLKALGVVGDQGSMDLLLERATSGTPDERQAAAASLAALPDPTVDEQLTGLLGSSANASRVAILQTFARRDTFSAVPIILDVAADPDPVVRRAAHQVLRELAQPTVLTEMIDRLRAAPASQRDAWVTTLGRVLDRMPLDATRTTELLSALADTPDPGLRVALLSALGQTGVDSALPALQEALNDPAAEVRIVALRQLAAWATAAPRAALQDVLTQSPSPLEHTLALRGSIRMIGLQPDLSQTERLHLYQTAMDSQPAVPEQRLILSGLAALGSLDALRYAQGFLSPEALNAEAELACVSIARNAAGTWPEECRPVLQTIARGGLNPTARARAGEVLGLLNKATGFITTWEVSPPYDRGGQNYAQLFELAFPPEQVQFRDSVPWQSMPALANPEQPWLLDLLALHGGEQRVAYLRTELVSDQDQDVVLELGSDDGGKAWVNDALVWAHNTQRAVEPGQDLVPVQLRQGANRLLVKVTQNVMGWGFCARMLHKDGTPVSDVRARLPENAPAPPDR